MSLRRIPILELLTGDEAIVRGSSSTAAKICIHDEMFKITSAMTPSYIQRRCA